METLDLINILTDEEFVILRTLLNKIAKSTIDGKTIDVINSQSGIKIKFKSELKEEELYQFKKDYEHFVFEHMSEPPYFTTAYIDGIKKGMEL